MRYVEAKECVVIPLGRQGENNVETVSFPVQGWRDLYGEGSFELMHQRNKDRYPYPCPIEVTGEDVLWVIRDTDTAFAGRGQAQLTYVVGGAVAKSIVFATCTLRSVDGGGDVPEPYQDWVDEVLAAGAHAVEASLDSEAWAVGTRDGEEVTEDDETYHNNSKFYAEMAEQSAADAGYMNFHINEDGDLIMERTDNVDVTFFLEDGDLYLGVA